MQNSDAGNFDRSSIDRPQEKSPILVADIAGSFTYASYQNAIPVVRGIKIENADGRHHENIRLELASSPAFLRAKSWTIDRLAPGDSLSISDRKIESDAADLAGLTLTRRVGSLQCGF